VTTIFEGDENFVRQKNCPMSDENFVRRIILSDKVFYQFDFIRNYGIIHFFQIQGPTEHFEKIF